jgi:hypothetical protein
MHRSPTRSPGIRNFVRGSHIFNFPFPFADTESSISCVLKAILYGSASWRASVERGAEIDLGAFHGVAEGIVGEHERGMGASGC